MNFCGQQLKIFGKKRTSSGNELFFHFWNKKYIWKLPSPFSQLWTSTQYWGIKQHQCLSLLQPGAAGAAATPADWIFPCTQCGTSLAGPACCPSFWSLSYMYHKVDELCEEKGLLYLNRCLCVLLLRHYNLFTIIKCHFSSIRPHFI